MNYLKTPHSVPDPRKRLRHLSASAFALALVAGQSGSAYADISNTATATGSSPGNTNDVTDSSLQVNVPVAPAAASLTVGKSVAAPVDTVADGVIRAGDTIAYTFTVWNRGNVTMYNVAPVDAAHTFDGIAADNAMGAFTPATITLAPGASQVFTATYTLTDADAYRAAGITDAVSNTMSATGNIGNGAGPVIAPANVTTETIVPGQSDTATTTIPATAQMTVVKSAPLPASLVKAPGNTHADAEIGDTINYTYVVTNTGNVTLTNVSIDDVHEGASLGAGTVANETETTDGPLNNSADETPVAANNGTWVTLGAGAVVTFTYAHSVTQAEFDSQ